MKTRTLEASDYDALLALWQRSGLPSLKPNGRDSREAFVQQLASGVQTVWGLEKDGQLIGAVVATHDGRKGWINRLVIDPAHRRQGHAKRLIAAAEESLKAQGMHVIATLIESWNEASLALFQKEGYRLHDAVHYLSKRDSAEV
jgi:ribosomal protein S18 acetylase RimI-like enzyme